VVITLLCKFAALVAMEIVDEYAPGSSIADEYRTLITAMLPGATTPDAGSTESHDLVSSGISTVN
jgi:hypothetical protein